VVEVDDQHRAHGRAIFYLSALIGGLILLALGYPIFLGEIYTAQDLGHFYLPLRWFYQRSLLDGDSFTWFPYWFNGFYVHGSGQGAFYHPFKALLYLLFPLGPALNLELLSSYVFFAGGAYLFFRRIALSREAALFGAILAAFSAANLLHYFMINVMAGFAHLPWNLLAIDYFMRGPSPHDEDAKPGWRPGLGGAGLALLTGSQLLVGHPQAIWMSGLVELAYLLVLIRRRDALLSLASLAAAKGLGFMIGAVQFLPMLDVLSASVRVDSARELGVLGALHPLDLMQFFGPSLFERGMIGAGGTIMPVMRADLGLYAGALVPPMLIWLCLCWRRGRLPPLQRRLLTIFIGLAAIVLVLAMGDAGGLYRLQRLLPIVGLFNTPSRYGMAVHFLAAVMMAIGFEQLLERSRENHRGEEPRAASLLPSHEGWFAIAPVVALLVMAVVAWLGPALGLPKRSDWMFLLLGPGLAGVAVLLLMQVIRGARWAMLVLIVFALVEPAIYGLSLAYRYGSESIPSYLKARPVPEQYSPDQRVLMLHPTLALQEVRMTLGWIALVPAYLGKLMAPKDAAEVAWAKQFGRLSGIGPTRMPRVRLVSEAAVSDRVFEDLPGIDIARTALVAHSLDLESAPAGSAVLRSERPGYLEVEVSTSSRQLLVVSESHHAGWQVRVNGVRADVIPVYEHFLGVVVEPGSRRVRFDFQPESLRRGQMVSAAGLVVAAGWAALCRPRSQRQRRPRSQRQSSV
jgi:hypothetical protein